MAWRPAVELLESRLVLALTSGVAAGVLTVTSNANDGIAITTAGGNVKINGADPTGGPFASATITEIHVQGGPLAPNAFGSPGNNTIDLTGVHAADFTLLTSILAAGGAGNDVILGSDFPERLLGGLGNDVIFGNQGDDEIDGGAGDDTVQGGGGNDTVAGGLGDDEVLGGAGDDVLRGDTTDTPRGLADDGFSQSPVDIPANTPTQELIDEFHYEPAPLDLQNNNIFEAHFEPQNVQNTIEVAGVEFELDNIHFHAPSEYTFGGQVFAMEIHFVHATPEGGTAVLGVFVQVGAANAAFQSLLDNAPPTGTRAEIPGVEINPADFLPADHRVFAFTGSLTTPPFTEGLNWFSFATPITFSQAQINAYTAMATAGAYFPNARATQPINGREFGHGDDVLNGGQGDDEIFPGGGNDQVVASSGNDAVHDIDVEPVAAPPDGTQAALQRAQLVQQEGAILARRLLRAEGLAEAGNLSAAQRVRRRALRRYLRLVEGIAVLPRNSTGHGLAARVRKLATQALSSPVLSVVEPTASVTSTGSLDSFPSGWGCGCGCPLCQAAAV